MPITAEMIRGIRAQLGISQNAFAERIGVTRDAVAQWETGRCTPSGPAEILIHQIAAIAEIRTNRQKSAKTGVAPQKENV